MEIRIFEFPYVLLSRVNPPHRFTTTFNIVVNLWERVYPRKAGSVKKESSSHPAPGIRRQPQLFDRTDRTLLKGFAMITPPELFKSLADETRARATLLIANWASCASAN
jgi:hypothetical protein